MAELGRYFRIQRIGAVCLVLATLLLLGLRALSLPLSEPRADQSQFLGYAYNMLKHGEFSVNRTDRPRADQMREPGYPLLLAAGMLLHPGLDLDEADARCVTQGKGGCIGRVTWLKLVNLVFLGLSGLAVFAALLALTGRPAAAWAGYLWVMLSASYAQYAGLFFSEVVVGFLIVALSLRLWRLAGQPPDRRQWFLAGLLLGALVMVKATFYYLVPLLAVAMAAHAARRRAVPLGQAAILGLIFLGGTLALTVPWHARNMISTGTTSLAGRAGLVLTVRANYDELPAEDLLAAAALFTPHNTAPRAYLASRWLTPEADARLTAPDNPRDRAFTRLEELRQQTRLPVFGPELDDMLKREAMTRIGELWPQHLRATLLFGYRGLFAERGLGFAPSSGRPVTLGGEAGAGDLDGWVLDRPVLINLLLFLPAFAAFAFCVATARWALVILMLPAAYLYGLQALMTHYIPRYSAPLIPMLVVIAVLVGTAMWDRIVVMLRGWQAGRREADATSTVPSQLRAYLARRPVAGVCLVALTLALLGLRAADMPVVAPSADQSQYLAYAHNLVRLGKFSANWGGSKPDQRREPGYPLLLGAAMLIHPGLELRSITARCIADGEARCVDALTGLKAVNLLFLGLSGIAAFAAVLVLTRTALLAWAALLWVMLSVAYGNFAVRFFPEVIVGFVLVALSMRLWRLAIIPPERRAWFLSGLLLGALVMLKATFYYLVPLLALALAGHAALRRAVPRREAVLLGLIFLAGTLVLTVPWQLRNAISTGTIALAGRAGLVLTVRANYNELSPTEMLAAAAVFSPAHTAPESLFGRWLTPEINAMLIGPENPRARGYTRQGELAAPHRYTARDADLDRMLKREALARIRADLPAHLRGTLLFGYRGLFIDRGFGYLDDDGESHAPRLGTRLVGVAPGGWLLYSPVLLNFVLFGTAFAAFAYCIATARWPLVFLMLPAAYLYAIQAFMTHNIPRYGVALIPMLVVILMLAAAATASRLIGSPSR